MARIVVQKRVLKIGIEKVDLAFTCSVRIVNTDLYAEVLQVNYRLLTSIQGGTKKVSHYQIIKKNRIKSH